MNKLTHKIYNFIESAPFVNISNTKFVHKLYTAHSSAVIWSKLRRKINREAIK